MSITPKFREDGSGGAQDPYAADLDSHAVTIDDNGRTGLGATPTAAIDANGRLALHVDVNGGGVGAWASGGTSFADGVLRGVARASNDILHVLLLSARKLASNGTHVSLGLNYTTGADLLELRYGTKDQSLVTSVAKTLALDTDYECVFFFLGTTYKLVEYTAGTFPPGSDYKTITWDIDTTSAAPPTITGKAAVAHNRFETADVTGYWDDVLAWAAGESADTPTVSLVPGNTLVTVSLAGVAADEKRASFWRFLRYKAGSQPTDENDGTLVTGAGTGLGGSAIRSDGRFLDIPAAFDITGLSNGTTYFVRPFVVMADGTIVAGTAQSATPSGSDITAPTSPADFAVAYDDPFVDAKHVLTCTQPSEAGDYKINFRADGIPPDASDDASATTLVDWTAYAANDPLSEDATGLTAGTRYFWAIWHKDAAANISAGAFDDKVAVNQLVQDSPADGATGVSTEPYAVWHTAAGEAEDGLPVQYRLEISTSEASEADFVTNRFVDVSSMTNGPAGYEYEDSAGVWLPLPVDGLADADVGKDVRYHATELGSSGHFYRRITPQQPGS